MISLKVILFSLLVGFGLPILIAILAYRFNHNKTSKPIIIDRRESSDLDLQKLRFIKETEFWRDYNKE